ncbi:UNKNOWN [Stylonychia lemnae]|uniref:PhoD-like phosphatase metallophosphatase domain-containing protein n=1 Tax=Stylonychia lemnae TaxID=5949 RepID=A0A078AK31_STYLE|nr:UNKNOWN [Stylonychia lemnae]|eukprot:CDW81812.1 UNKNOWN [Stylonychia lemnae]
MPIIIGLCWVDFAKCSSQFNQTLESNKTSQTLNLSKKKSQFRTQEKVVQDFEQLKIAFGSCFGMLHFKNEIFKTIRDYDPNLWIWLGDAAYTDDVAAGVYQSDNSMPVDYVQSQFQQTLDDPYFQEMRSKVQVIGVWDDHDYGLNNGDSTFENKQMMRKLYLDFINEPKSSLRYTESHRGVYQDYIIYHEGLKIHIVLLDVRFHYNEDGPNDRLGELQYQWLETILRENSDSDLTLIGSGVQILPERYTSYVEQLGHPSKERILKMVRELKKSGVIFLSGDVHYAQFYQTKCESFTGYNIMEICSSGLSHYLKQACPSKLENFIEGHTPKIFKDSEIYMNINFATIQIYKKFDKENLREDVLVSLTIRDEQGFAVEERVLSLLKDLKFDSTKTRYSSMCTNIQSKAQKILMFNRLIESFIVDKDPQFIYQFILLISFVWILPLCIYDYSNDIFKIIKSHNPDIWIWNGDAAYTDDVSYIGQRQLFVALINIKDYQDFISDPVRKPKVIGIWDDHDYGINDGDKSFLFKQQNRQIYLDFIQEPQDTQRRIQNDTGIFQDYVVKYENISVHIILLDLRYDFDKQGKDRFGEKQIEWLDNLLKIKTDLKIIVSGIQVIPDNFFYNEQMQSENKLLLFDLIAKNQVSGVIFLSGDVHYTQIYNSNCESITGGYKMYEFVSSGMTHHANIFQYRIQDDAQFVTSQLFSEDHIKVDFNFGLIKIQKSFDDVELEIQIRNLQDEIITYKRLSLSKQLKHYKKNTEYQQMCRLIHTIIPAIFIRITAVLIK